MGHEVIDNMYAIPGSDGIMYFWDTEARTRLKSSFDFFFLSPLFPWFTFSPQLAFDQAPAPISATAFNKNGTIFAYAISYDWSKGHVGAGTGAGASAGGVKLMLHQCTDEESKKRPRR